ncbi:hypothetical protein BCR41DRAFT_385697 [Lobosporangium transversale]|uniref:HTH CENPB-type domain-containing protein n=1 Tax=Lobosporangium transversale TaxID=64571 RepID=A0A1Y2GSV1_9FUNG|nr:hypothetical protein BCR41DRAFT_385697 [Lobosporangium transversale]ORZ20161.1 hypothetical protein BCR41DRAFT_385697 [Lobosporangium transversale]|eukprot:XP_021882701.1 hypothetical protein BCR41DRAFT_385697 [Lobosporangium transversale]
MASIQPSQKYRSIQPSPASNNDRNLTIKKKLEILEEWDKHVACCNMRIGGGSLFEPEKKVFCDYHNITPGILNNILAKREVLQNIPISQSSIRYRLPSSTRSFYPVEAILFRTIEHVRRDLFLPIDSFGVRIMAGAIYELLETRVGELAFEKPKFSNGWLNGFQRRYALHRYNATGEASSVDMDSIRPQLDYIKNVLKQFSEYLPRGFKTNPSVRSQFEVLPWQGSNKQTVADLCGNWQREFNRLQEDLQEMLLTAWTGKRPDYMRTVVFEIWLLRFQLRIAAQNPSRRVALLLDHAPSHTPSVDIFCNEQELELRGSEDQARARDPDVAEAIRGIRQSFRTRLIAEATENFDAESDSLHGRQDPAQRSFENDDSVLTLFKFLDESRTICKYIDSLREEDQFKEFFISEDGTNMIAGQDLEEESMDGDDYGPSASLNSQIVDEYGHTLSPVKRSLQTRRRKYSSYRVDRVASPEGMDGDDDSVAEDIVELNPSVDIQDPYILMDAAAVLRHLGHDNEGRRMEIIYDSTIDEDMDCVNETYIKHRRRVYEAEGKKLWESASQKIDDDQKIRKKFPEIRNSICLLGKSHTIASFIINGFNPSPALVLVLMLIFFGTATKYEAACFGPIPTLVLNPFVLVLIFFNTATNCEATYFGPIPTLVPLLALFLSSLTLVPIPFGSAAKCEASCVGPSPTFVITSLAKP